MNNVKETDSQFRTLVLEYMLLSKGRQTMAVRCRKKQIAKQLADLRKSP